MSQLFNDERRRKDKFSKMGREQADKIRLKLKIEKRNQRDNIREWISNDVRMVLSEMMEGEMDLRQYILTLTPKTLWELSRHAQKCHTLNLSGWMQINSVGLL